MGFNILLLPLKPWDEKDAESRTALDQKLPFLSTAVMTACNGLTLVEGEIVGDPLEKAALQAVQWMMIGPDLVTSKPSKGGDRLHILRRYPFASELQRMAVLAQHHGPGLGYREEGSASAGRYDRVLGLVKGSCDALKPRLLDAPENLDDLQDQLTKVGFRVLCLAAKEMKELDVEATEREEVESSLHFCGLLVLPEFCETQHFQHYPTAAPKLSQGHHDHRRPSTDSMSGCHQRPHGRWQILGLGGQ